MTGIHEDYFTSRGTNSTSTSTRNWGKDFLDLFLAHIDTVDWHRASFLKVETMAKDDQGNVDLMAVAYCATEPIMACY
jgi:hypothetical protein